MQNLPVDSNSDNNKRVWKCRHCKRTDVVQFVWTNDKSGWKREFVWCKPCVASSMCEVGCFFCERTIGYQFGFEWAGDGDQYKCCGECRANIFGPQQQVAKDK